jgi:uncharacterized DUF497 family protein
MGFQWDPDMDAANQAKHLIGFRQAAEIFRGFRLVREDSRRDYGEHRFISLGLYDGTVLRVVHVERDGDILGTGAGCPSGLKDSPICRRPNR